MINEGAAQIKQGANNDLNDKIKQLEYLNHMMAHNLRGVAANIKMFAEILASKNIPDDCQKDGDDDVFTISETIQYIGECSNSMLGTLNTLMEATEVVLEEQIKYDECDIAATVAHITTQLKAMVAQKNAIIALDLPITHIRYPVPYLESILYNFIHNALKYSKEDVPLKVSISTYLKDGRIALSVKDNGIGIDLQLHGRRIFNLYQVFHHGYESKGVGLYIIKKQIESLGGRVYVNSNVNEGSEFVVVF